mmetsp:Transcript_98374/g.228120  ORF Transcript_98374/g.228120 Transcript_98374/m.228120 type:complete len:358 (-) Transcript_98374:127-1200(-)
MSSPTVPLTARGSSSQSEVQPSSEPPLWPSGPSEPSATGHCCAVQFSVAASAAGEVDEPDGSCELDDSPCDIDELGGGPCQLGSSHIFGPSCNSSAAATSSTASEPSGSGITAGGSSSDSGYEPLVCPDEDSALVQRIRPLQRVVPTPEADSWQQAAKALEVDDRESGWNGPVAIERSDGPRPPLTGPRSLVGAFPGYLELPVRQEVVQTSKLDDVRQQLRSALLTLEECDLQQRLRDGECAARREAVQRTAELAEARAEALQLRRELLRLRGRPAELAALPIGSLHSLQQELSTSLLNVQSELESRTKCCICREVERQVLLLPCQHLALCSACSRRVDRCPLCRANIERCEVVVVA